MSHRQRLTLLLTASVSVALIVVFAALLLVLHQQALARRFGELQQSVARIANEWNGPDAATEEHEDYPAIDFAVYEASGRLLTSSMKNPIPFSEGRSRDSKKLYVGVGTNRVKVIGAISWDETESGLLQLAWVLAGLWLPITLLTAAVSWYGGGLVLRPVTDLVASAERLSATSGDHLLQTSDEAEFATLANALNSLIERVRSAAKIQEQFASDAAHELRTPLALLRTRIEATLLNERSAADYQQSLTAMLTEVDCLTSILETLLASARDQANIAEPIQLDDAVAEFVQQWAKDSGKDLNQVVIETQPVQATITREELTILLRNVLDNAARYSPVAGVIKVQVTATKDAARLSITDEGTGLSKDERDHAFDRLYRSDDSRSRHSGGTGIGLAVVKRIVESRGGRVWFEARERGAELVVTLPRADIS